MIFFQVSLFFINSLDYFFLKEINESIKMYRKKLKFMSITDNFIVGKIKI